MLRATVTALMFFAGATGGATAAEILIGSAQSRPESLAAAPDGSVITGSANSPYIYRVKSGAEAAVVFVDASREGAGTFFLGQLVEAATNTLWACQLTPVLGTAPSVRRSILRSFDLATGTEKLRWNFPDDNSTCNDLAVGPDKALYISDTANGKIYRLPQGARSADLYMQNRLLNGIDGLTFLGSVLYVNNVIFNKLYRIPVDASGKPGAPLDIWMDAPVMGLDGMRAADGKLFVAASESRSIFSIKIDGDIGHVTSLKDSLDAPSGVEPSGKTLWFTERGAGKIASIPMPR